MNKKINILIPMAGLGTRFKQDGFNTPKPLIEINGKTLIEHSVESLNIDGNYIFITRRYEEEGYNKILSDKLKAIKPDSVEIIIDNPTRGAVETCLMAKKLIDNDNPLIVTNCDQRLDWDSSLFLNFISETNCDGSVVIFDSIDPKNSFAKIDQNNVILQIVEKNPISRNALMGIHFWKNGKDFISSSNELLNTFENTGRPECYVSESYNFLIQKNKKIVSYVINNNEFNSLGTPNDLRIFQAKIKEFYTDKPSTIFCDIDGTILKHVHGFSNVVSTEPELLKGVLEKFNQWDSQGHKIVLCTARKESAREITESHLKRLGLCWDHLIMGLTSGNRYLINDKLNIKDQDRAVAVNLTTNFGFLDINWNKHKL
jgi:NDP-sugar pyrophosphorylase family protein